MMALPHDSDGGGGGGGKDDDDDDCDAEWRGDCEDGDDSSQ